MAIDTVISSVLGAVNAVWTLLNSILELTSIILNIPNFIRQLSLGKLGDLLKREQCEELIAAIMACLLNKFLGDPFEKFQTKILTKINEVGYNVNQALADEFYDLNVCAAYVEQEAFLLNKCSHQMEGLYTSFGMELDPSEQAKAAANSERQKASVDSKGNIRVKGTNTNSAKSDNPYADSGMGDLAVDSDPFWFDASAFEDNGGPTAEVIETSFRQEERMAHMAVSIPGPDIIIPAPVVDEYESKYALREQNFGDLDSV